MSVRISFEPDAKDDPEFIVRIRAIVEGVVADVHPTQFYLVKIDNWFGKRWLRFSGKTLGALGVRKGKLTVPPFIPSRVVFESRFTGQKRPIQDKPVRLHRYQWSGTNLQRRLDGIAPQATLFWFSGNSLKNGRGSLMAYVFTAGEYWLWYAGFERQHDWRALDLDGITATELASFERPSATTH